MLKFNWLDAYKGGGQVGLFGKKVPQTEKDRASNAFADRDKTPLTTDDGDVAGRVLEYNKLKGAETLQRQAGPISRVDELRQIRDDRSRDKEYEAKQGRTQHEQASAEGKMTAGDAVTARSNLIASNAIKRRKKLNPEEVAEIERQGLEALAGITATYKNTNLLTDVAANTADNTENFDNGEIGDKTAVFRNVGLLTETEVDEFASKPLTKDEKLNQDLEELESAEKAISSYANPSFREKDEEPTSEEGGTI